MAYSIQPHTGDGVLQNFNVPYPYILQAHVLVYVNDALQALATDYTWLNATTIRFNSAPAVAAQIQFRRESARATRLVTFQDASVLSAGVSNASDSQNFYVAQEALDLAGSAVTLSSDNAIDAGNKRIKNLASGTLPTDAVTKAQLDSAAIFGVTPTATSLATTPSGNLAATNVQAAVNELQSDIDTRAPLNSATLTGTPSAPTFAIGTNTTLLATTAFTQAALAAFPRYGNRIINGALLVDQRNAGVAVAVTSGTAVFPADRWMAWAGGVAAATATRTATGPGQFSLDYALNMQRTAGNAATVALNLGQIVESVNWRALAGQAVTVSFYAVRGANFSGASNLLTANVLTGTANDQGRASLIAGTWTGQATAPQTFALTTTWTRYSYTFTVPAGALEGSVVFSYTPVGTAGAADSFAVSGVDIRAGAVLTAFDHAPIGDILRSCQRYYWAGAAPYISGGCNVNTTSAWIHTYNFPTTMRVAPTATMQGTWVSTGVTGLAVSGNSADTYAVSFNVAGPNANAAWTIAPNSSDDRVAADAEL